MFDVYNDHGLSHIILPPMRTLKEVKELAQATVGYDALYRAFRQTTESITGRRFETAFSVLNGVVREHKDVTIPAAHWHSR